MIAAPPNCIAVLRELLRRAVLTLAAMPDPDIKYRLGPKTAWLPIVRAARDAYGSAPPKFRLFVPTKRDLTLCIDVLATLDWYGRTYGETTPRLFIAWCFGAPLWQLQQRCLTNRRQPASPKTIYNRINGMIAIIARQSACQVNGWLDNFPDLQNTAAPTGYDAGLAETDLFLLPTSPKAINEPPAEVDRKTVVHARLLLEKRLQKNRMRWRN